MRNKIGFPSLVIGTLLLVGCGTALVNSEDNANQSTADELSHKHDAGTCASTCGGVCVDKQTDPNHCGLCRHACGVGESCVQGVCKGGGCAPGTELCKGQCVYTHSDPTNCGACGHSCLAGESCAQGACVGTCPSGETSCGGKCVTLASDPNNCGMCGNVCSSGVCKSGVCGQQGGGGAIGVHGGRVSLLHFGATGDTRPPNCEDTAQYPTAVVNSVVDQIRTHGAQFGVDLGDHMYVCNNDLSIATAQMNLYVQSIARLGQTWFMTQGNHECSHGPCLTGSTNANYVAFMKALAPVSSTPYYSFEVQTSLGLAIFVVVADNSWDSTQSAWLERTLKDADSRAAYTIVAKHHPAADTAVSTNSTVMAMIRRHKFSLLLTGHNHLYKHPKTDSARELILGTGGAPLIAGGSFYGYAMIDQQSDGRLQVSIYDLNSNTPVDVWSVGPN